MSKIQRLKYTKNIYLTPIGIKDAKYILKLRLNKSLTKYLNPTSKSITLQKKWIEKYLERNLLKQEYYFKFQIKGKKNFKSIGLARVIDLGKKNFHFGSWIIEEGLSKLLSIESVLAIYEFAFGKLKFKFNKMWIHKNNKKVILFHEALGSKKNYADHKQVYYTFSYKNYLTIKSRFGYFFK